jgi:hypothetical protein
MVIRRRFPVWHTPLIAGCCLLPAIAGADESDSGSRVNQREQWDRQIKSVKTAVITYRAVLRMANPAREHDEVIRLIKASDLVGNENAQKKLTVSLDSTLAGKADVWSSSVFTLRGKDVRVDATTGTGTTTHVLDDNIEMRSRPLSAQGQYQTDLYFRGDSHMHVASLADFGGGSTAWNEEAFQFGSVAVKGGPELPAVVVRVRFESGKLTMFSMTMIDKAVINEPIAYNAFVIPGKAGDVLLDVRAKPSNAISLRRACDNVLEVLNPAAQPAR